MGPCLENSGLETYIHRLPVLVSVMKVIREVLCFSNCRYD